MKTIKNLLASLFTVACLMPAFVSAAEAQKEGIMQEVKSVAQDISKNVSDATITTQIKAAYALEPNLRSMKISVTTQDGVVTLSGNVNAGLQKDRLVDIAKDVKGVVAVKSSAVEVTSSKSYFSDAMLTARSKVKIIQLYSDDKIASGYKVHVETTNGGVYLYGSVSNRDDANTIEKAISEITGVDSVYNNLKTKKVDA